MIHPSPKPSPSPKSPRRALKRSGRIKPKKRTAGEAQRIYGPPGRAEWVKAQRCVCCGWLTSENAHIANDGKSRKGHYTQIIPLCGPHPGMDRQSTLVPGCHHLMDQVFGRVEFAKRYSLDLEACAAEVERRWQAFSKEGE